MAAQLLCLLSASCALLPASPPSARPVEGPYRFSDPPADLGRDGIFLTYHASRRSSARHVPGRDGKVLVDVGIVGHGIEAYLATSDDLVVLDNASKEHLWSAPVGAWYRTLSFVDARDPRTGAPAVLLRVAGGAGPARYFEAQTGRERYPRATKTALVAYETADRTLRGRPIPVMQAWSGHDSRIRKPICVRVETPAAWARLWKEHTGRAAAPPAVDFGRYVVLGVFEGEGWNCSGIRLLHALDCGTATELFLRDSTYQTGPTANRVTPYGLFVLPRRPGALIVKQDRQGTIGGPPLWVERARFGG